MPVTRSASEKSSVTGDGGLQVSRRYTEAGTHAFKPRDLEGVLFPAYRVHEEDRPGLLEACRRSRLRGWRPGEGFEPRRRATVRTPWRERARPPRPPRG